MAKIVKSDVISPDPQYYCGWPTLARRRNGHLVLVYSGGREQHVCPFGRVEMMVSQDEGQNWRWPQTLIDGPIDDRDAGVLETSRGSLLVTTFTSLAYESILITAMKKKSGEPGAWPEARLNQWLAVHNRISPEQRQAELGQWMLRSTDGGITWSKRYSSIVNSPHGPIQLKDGRLLYPGKELWTGQRRTGIAESIDDGQGWKWVTEIPLRPGDTAENYHELHGVEAADGSVVVHIRNHNKTNAQETLQTVSRDGGVTWSVPEAIGVWGLPSHLLRLRNGNLLMSYGHRRAPLGNQARLSKDHGKTWSEPMIISGDGSSGDLGYPSTVELEDGSLLTVWYEHLKTSPKAVIRQAHWSLS
ncbi:MAG TPA: sialidase family protein [Roseimicrobium sp.]|nr:sialidase family protein [Roseimicrobium sp.]